MKNNKVDYTTIKDAARFLEIPVQRVEALIKSNQIFGISTGEGTGFVSVEDIIHLAEVTH